MTISKNSVVTIHYTLRDDQKKVIDSSSEQEPLVYLQGSGQIIPGLDDALFGRAKGDHVKVTVAPEQGYGKRVEQLVQSISKSDFEDADRIKVGMRFQVSGQNGPIILTVTSINESDIMVDGNHPLAGQTLHFEVEIKDVRKATPEELSHGHVHGAGGHLH